MTAHNMHRITEESLFDSFKRRSANHQHDSYRSMTASDILNLPGTQCTLSHPMQKSYRCRPTSEILQPRVTRDSSSRPEEAIDRWFENIQRYEEMLEEVATASLDQGFKDELHNINRWFRCRSDAERTAALYTVVRNASQIQIRFLITVLQQLINKDPYGVSVTHENDIPDPEKTQHSLFGSHTVISTESDYEMRKRQLYQGHGYRQCAPLYNKLSSVMSEPDDLRRRNRDLFVSRPLGLSHTVPLYEKALETRAQIQASFHTKSGTVLSSGTSSSISTTSSLTDSGLFSSSLNSSADLTDVDASSSLFSNQTTADWPFPITPKKKLTDDNWSFGSLSLRKLKSTEERWRIQEAERVVGHGDSYSSQSIQSSLIALEQAQARLKEHPSNQSHITKPSNPPPLHPTRAPSPDQVVQDDVSDDEQNEEKPLTGLARRRKRSSAARALKDKIAAETVDFELMKDVQSWLRSLRLHKYGHAFVGMNWRQVIVMSDQDMIDAGVNTMGARRKLLKVFENVQRHCEEHFVCLNSQYSRC
ncbi:hypothetical protein BDB01DRAFT_774695 [Pilobolus umbonatus]|nr:hypothetical protein BDB01DRAFT_774695 [Pilobolus umbonatus]